MIIEITEEEREFLHRVVHRTIEFCKMGIENNSMDSDFTRDKHKIELLRDKLIKDVEE
jgi:hypothetical protein